MELIESIERINELLIKEFGREFNNWPRFRIVFSEDQFEKRMTDCTDDGFPLLYPEVRLLPKYKQYVKQKYILERLIPIKGETDLTTNISYEPAWVFQDSEGNYLPPLFDACKFIIEAIYSQIEAAGNFTRYKDKNISPEERDIKLKDMEDTLFGNETPVGDALRHKYGVVVPGVSSGIANKKLPNSDSEESE